MKQLRRLTQIELSLRKTEEKTKQHKGNDGNETIQIKSNTEKEERQLRGSNTNNNNMKTNQGNEYDLIL
jgi:hypothetical protein